MNNFENMINNSSLPNYAELETLKATLCDVEPQTVDVIYSILKNILIWVVFYVGLFIFSFLFFFVIFFTKIMLQQCNQSATKTDTLDHKRDITAIQRAVDFAKLDNNDITCIASMVHDLGNVPVDQKSDMFTQIRRHFMSHSTPIKSKTIPPIDV